MPEITRWGSPNKGLSPDDIIQIVEALKSTAEFQFIREQMQAAQGAAEMQRPGEPKLSREGRDDGRQADFNSL